MLSYQIFKETSSVSLWICIFRELLFDIHPMLIMYPIILAMSFDLYKLIDIPSLMALSLTQIAVLVILIIIYLIFLKWSIPLYYSCQYMHTQNITTTIIKGNNIFGIFLFYAIVFIITLASRDETVCYAAGIVIFIYNAFMAYMIWYKPWSVKFRFYFMFTTHVSGALIAIIATIYFALDFFDEVYFFAIWGGIILLSLIICWILIQQKFKKMIRIIESSESIKLNPKNAAFLCQVALQQNKLNKFVLEYMDSVYTKDPSIPNLISLVICQFMYDNHSGDIDIMITTLANTHNLPRIFEFFIYELYKRYTNTSKVVCLLTGVESIDERILEYKSLSDKFWRQAMLGQTFSAVSSIIKLKFLLDDLCYDFRTFEIFFPAHSKVHSLYNEFFKKFTLKQDTKIDELNRITLSDNMWVSHDMTDGSSSVHSGSESSDEEDLRNNQQQWINDNVKKLIQKPISIGFVVVAIILWFIGIIGFCFFTLNNDHDIKVMMRSSFKSFPHYILVNSLNSVNQLMPVWYQFNYMLVGIQKGVSPITLTYDDIENIVGTLEFPNGTQRILTTTTSIFENLSTVLSSIQEEIAIVEQYIMDLSEIEEFSDFKEGWFLPNVETSANFYLACDQAITSIGNQVFLFLRDDPDITPTELMTRIQESWSYALTINEALNAQIDNIYTRLYNVLDKLLDENLYSKQTLIVGLILLAVDIIATISIILGTFYKFLNITIQHFRPDTHPNKNVKVSLVEKPSKNMCSYTIFFIILLYLFIWALLFVLQFLFNLAIVTDNNEIYRYCQSMMAIRNLTASSSMLAFGVIDRASFNEVATESFTFKDLHSDFSSSLTDFVTKLSSQYYANGRAERLMTHIDNHTCDISKNSSTFDLYDCWGTVVIGNFLTHFISRIEYEQRSTDNDFLQIQYLVLDKISKDLADISNFIAGLAIETATEIYFFTSPQFSIIMLCALFLFVFLFEILHFSQVIEIQYGKQITALSPMYTVMHQCLVSFVADLSESEMKPNEQTPFFEIYENAGVSVVVLTEKLVIVAFTKDVLKIFGYKAAQLLGQHIETLIPSYEKQWKNNDKKFYRQIELVKAHEASNRFSRTVTGCCSDRSPVDLKTSVSYVETNDGNYFIIEFRSIARETFYEEQYINSSKLINEYRNASMPIILFTNDPVLSRRTTFTKPIPARYRHYAAVYVGLSIDENYEMTDISESSFAPMKDMLALTTPLYSGVNGALVLDATCEYAIIIYVNNEENDAHLHNAVGFSLDFSEKNIYPTHGIIIEGEDIDVSLFPLQPTDSEHPLTQLRPAMTIEPSSEVIQKLAEAMPLVVENCLILPDNAAHLLVDVPAETFPNDLGMDLSIIEIKISSNMDQY